MKCFILHTSNMHQGVDSWTHHPQPVFIWESMDLNHIRKR